MTDNFRIQRLYNDSTFFESKAVYHRIGRDVAHLTHVCLTVAGDLCAASVIVLIHTLCSDKSLVLLCDISDWAVLTTHTTEMSPIFFYAVTHIIVLWKTFSVFHALNFWAAEYRRNNSNATAWLAAGKFSLEPQLTAWSTQAFVMWTAWQHHTTSFGLHSCLAIWLGPETILTYAGQVRCLRASGQKQFLPDAQNLAIFWVSLSDCTAICAQLLKIKRNWYKNGAETLTNFIVAVWVQW